MTCSYRITYQWGDVATTRVPAGENIGIRRQQVLNRLVISRKAQERFIAVNFPWMVSIGGSGGTD